MARDKLYIKATCDKRVHQKSMKADSLFGIKGQRKFCGSDLSAINAQSCITHVCCKCGQELRGLVLSLWGTEETTVHRGKRTGKEGSAVIDLVEEGR